MIGDVRPEHHAKLLRLNEAFVHWLSPLDAEALRALLGRCDYARQTGDGQAFLLGYDGDGPYRHKNVDWLSARLGRYSYIDRVVVAPEAQGLGLARRLYDDMAAWSRKRGRDCLACEVNTRPDNPGSHAFHARLGFEVLGDADYGDVSLRYYAKRLTG